MNSESYSLLCVSKNVGCLQLITEARLPRWVREIYCCVIENHFERR